MASRYAFFFSILVVLGCAEDADVTSPDVGTADVQSTDARAKEFSSSVASADSGDFDFKPLSTSAQSGDSGRAGASQGSGSTEENLNVVMEQLKPLQVILGQWRGTTRKEFDGFKAVDSHEWIWNLEGVPSLTVKSDKSPYLRTASLTWEPRQKAFLLSATDAAGVTREYAGDFTDPVHEIIGPDDKPHRVFRLEFTQTPESATKIGGEAWQISLAQQENNRYLLEVAKRRGKASFRRYDTVSTQRDGTSFALSDSDYGEKTCIISQGLGTTAVSYKGKTYWVCCSGCKAAFEEDPATWIARAEKRAAEMK